MQESRQNRPRGYVLRDPRLRGEDDGGGDGLGVLATLHVPLYTSTMHFHIITIFPNMFQSYLSDSIMKRAQESGAITFSFYDPRAFTTDKHRKVDDSPYGGGPGMVMTAQPILDVWESIVHTSFLDKAKELVHLKEKKIFKTILLSPGGEKFTTDYAKAAVGEYTDIIFICGRYEGIDSRVVAITGAELVSIGDYVLTGGELAAMVMCDSIARQVDGVLGNTESLEEERISSHEMYTRPDVLEWKGKKYPVPEVLLSGDHKKIDAWREGR